MTALAKIEIDKKAFHGDGSMIKFECQTKAAIQSGFIVLFEGKYHA
jgi:hypothetical protein